MPQSATLRSSSSSIWQRRDWTARSFDMVWRRFHCNRPSPGRLGVPDLDVVEPAVLAANTEFNLGLGGVADPGGFQIPGRFPVESHTHFFACSFDDEVVPFAGLDVRGIGDLTALEQRGALGLLCGILAHLVDIVAHGAIALVDDRDSVGADLRAAEVAVVGA